MADLTRSPAFFAALTAALAAGCGSEAQVLLLDRICNPDFPMASTADPCTVSGDAELTTGITGDTTAVRFGSGTGELRILLAAIPAAAQGRWSFEALAASSRSEGSTLYRTLSWGGCGGGTCPSDPEDVEAPLTEDFQWAAMVNDLPGSFNVQSSADSILTLRGADIDLIDVRTPGFDYYYY